jgi:hypothetical protein
MPAATISAARDEILARLKTALDASTFQGITVVYDDAVQDQPKGEVTPPPEPVPPGKPWLRAGVRHSAGVQASLGTVNGKRRQEMSGLVFIQVFTPSGDGQKGMDDLVEVILDAYRTGGATPSGVQFRSARFAEIGKSGVWHQTNCLADFEYDQIK